VARSLFFVCLSTPHATRLIQKDIVKIQDMATQSLVVPEAPTTKRPSVELLKELQAIHVPEAFPSEPSPTESLESRTLSPKSPTDDLKWSVPKDSELILLVKTTCLRMIKFL